MPPDISVVIPVRDGAATIPALLDSLACQELEAGRFEVIVVDNASRDETPQIAAERGARVVSEPVANRSRARNAGVAAARSDVIAFTDADCTVEPQWLARLLDCRGQAPLVAGPVVMETRARPNVIEQFESAGRFDQAAWVRQGWAATANLMVERQAFETIGGFDSEYRHIGEDADFCVRAARAGFPLAFCAAATVRHGAEHELGPVLRRAFFNGYSAAQVKRRLDIGAIAWRHPRPLLSPRRALEWHGVDPARLPPGQRARQQTLAYLVYASRVAGSLWSSVRRAR